MYHSPGELFGQGQITGGVQNVTKWPILHHFTPFWDPHWDPGFTGLASSFLACPVLVVEWPGLKIGPKMCHFFRSKSVKKGHFRDFQQKSLLSAK